MIVNMVKFIVKLSNDCPSIGGITNTSTHLLLTGITMNYSTYFKIQFGVYSQTHEDNDPTNSMEPQTIGAIALGPDDSIQGGYYLLNLNTEKL